MSLVADAAGHLARAYDVTGPCRVLIRPDGYSSLIRGTGGTGEVEE